MHTTFKEKQFFDLAYPSFTTLIAIAMAVALFVAGRFGFFDILGIKRIFEILLFVPIGLIALMLIGLYPNICLQPFFLLPFFYLIFQTYFNPDLLILADLSMATLFSAIILILGEKFANLLLRCIICIATFFAFLGIIEFFILMIHPSLVSQILLFYDYYSGSTFPVIDNALQLLGLADGTCYHLWGSSVTRLRSFTSEPSLLVGYFLVPGALALTDDREHYAWCGLICIVFCILSLAGSVYAALACAFFASILLLIKKRHLATVLPFILLTIFIWLLYSHFSDLILLTKKFGNEYDFLDKTNSANMRFGYIRDFLPKIIASPFGVDEEIKQPLGLLLGSLARAGIIGFALATLILIKIYSEFDSLFNRYDLYFKQQIGLLIVYGSITMGLLYLDNCFIQLYGFTLLLLIYNRLKNIRGRLDKI